MFCGGRNLDLKARRTDTRSVLMTSYGTPFIVCCVTQIRDAAHVFSTDNAHGALWATRGMA